MANYAPVLPPPPTFGIDEKLFPEWRPNQDVAVDEIIMSDKRFNVMVCPTGFGKTVMYIVAAIMNGGRTLILTATNPLSHQIMSEFGNLCVQIKGKANYPCKKIGKGVSCDKGPCNFGQSCSYKDSGCVYYDAVRVAANASIVVTNYAYWIYNNKARQDENPIGAFDMIVCDEAHDSPNKVADAYVSRFSTRNEVERYLLQPYDWSDSRESVDGWARGALVAAQSILKEAKREGLTERSHQASGAVRKLKEVVKQLTNDPEGYNTIVVPEKKWGVLRVAMAWPFEKAMDVLFGPDAKIVLTSATVRPKTVHMLGVDELATKEYPHIIPQHRRMLYHIPTVRLNYQTDAIGMRTWVTRMDQIIKPRRERNGIIHPVSYDRRNLILRSSKNSDIMVSHGKSTEEAQEAISKFREAQGGRVLVSPSVTTGYDFPYDCARYQIIGKIAFPDTSDPITKERCKRDDDYSPYVAMQTLVQTVGRIVRAADDWGESFIVDDNIKWFIWKYSDFAPEWFAGSFKSVGSVPKPYEGE